MRKKIAEGKKLCNKYNNFNNIDDNYYHNVVLSITKIYCNWVDTLIS